MKIVFDANILIRAFVKPRGPAGKVLHATRSAGHTLILSSEILRETMQVLRRQHMMTLHRRTENDVFRFSEWLRKSGEIYPVNLLWSSPIRDPGDIFVLQTALSGDADAICTLDRDFFTPPASDFLALRKIMVLTDVQLLQRLRQ